LKHVVAPRPDHRVARIKRSGLLGRAVSFLKPASVPQRLEVVRINGWGERAAYAAIERHRVAGPTDEYQIDCEQPQRVFVVWLAPKGMAEAAFPL
jgi:hypothetical protein